MQGRQKFNRVLYRVDHIFKHLTESSSETQYEASLAGSALSKCNNKYERMSR